MNKKLIIHDLKEGKEILDSVDDDVLTFKGDSDIHHCIGCFGCWIKTPGKCLIKDRAQKLPKMIASCSEMIIISKNFYGGFSPDVKCSLDRSIGYILPFFRIVNNEMHHIMRNNNFITMKAHIYGDDITQDEKNLLNNILKANALNLGGKALGVEFYTKISEMKGCII